MAWIVSIVGAGGKTTLAHELANKYCGEKKRVLVTTTTHMFIENDTVVTDKADDILNRLEAKGYCMAGSQCDEDLAKIKALPEDVLNEVLSHVDVCIIEADGAKHHTIKYPRSYEPVILPMTDEVIVVMGTRDIGKIVKDVVFGYEEAVKHLGISGEDVVTFEMIQKIVHKGYVLPIRENHTEMEIKVLYSDKNGKWLL